jgi:nucleoside-diphosphate-sugar epimerase
MRILLTGSNGYIGSVMKPILQADGHDVVGLDVGYFSSCRFFPEPSSERFIHKDIRDLSSKDLGGFDAVVHLAALSNDPIGNLRESWTRNINLEGTVRLAELARKAGVGRFLFASSCIMYGTSESKDVTEDSPLAPATEYARSKAQAEEALAKVASADFSPIYIRNGTVYGPSPRMRFDTVLNNLMGQAVSSRKVVIFSNGEPWRPVVHVEDIARTFMQFLKAPRSAVHNHAFNNGAPELNCRIRELAQIVLDIVPGSTLEIRGEADADQRTYKADFGKFARTFPDFRFKWNPKSGARHLYDALMRLDLRRETFDSSDFTRLKHLNRLLSDQKLDQDLKWHQSVMAVPG